MSNSTVTLLLITNTNFLENMLSHENCKIATASSHNDGIQILQKVDFDYLILDVNMLDDSVITLLKHSKNNSTPTLVLTENEDYEFMNKIYEFDASVIYKKQLSDKTLILSIVHWIQKQLQITKLKKDQHLLEEYKDAVDSSNIVSKADSKGFITFVNDQFCEISGYSRDELLGKPHNVVRHPDMSSTTFKDMWNTIESKETWRGVVKNSKKNNSGAYYVDTTIKPIVDSTGDIVEYIGIRKDITEYEILKQQLKDKLSATTENLQEMMKRSSEYHKAMEESTILTRSDLDGKIIYVNDEFTTALGYTLEEVKGKDHRIMKHPFTPKIIMKHLWQTILAGKTWKGMIQNLDKYGNTVWLDTVIVPIRNMEEKVVEYLAIRHNVSEIIHLQEEIESTEGELIYTLGAAAEARSKETSNHIRRVAHYSKLLALMVGMDDKEAELLFQASPMHDIGKLAIPDDILKKPGKLTSHEWDVMRTHSELGYEILASATRPILKAAATVAYEHHEKWDGSGYPRGLKGEEIHIYGRISSVADVFDALGSDRVYKKAWELEKILELFKDERGKHFDPQLVDLLLENIDKFMVINKQFKDYFQDENIT